MNLALKTMINSKVWVYQDVRRVSEAYESTRRRKTLGLESGSFFSSQYISFDHSGRGEFNKDFNSNSRI